MEPYSYIPVAKARPAIRKVIAKGGSAMVQVGREIRCLQHFPTCDRPRIRFPWPLSKIQPFWFRISRRTSPRGKIVAGIELPSWDFGSSADETEIKYNHSQVEEGIEV